MENVRFFVQGEKVFTLPISKSTNKILNIHNIEEETVSFSRVISECNKATHYQVKTEDLQTVYDGFSDIFASYEEATAAILTHNEEVVRNLKVKAAEELAKKGML